MHMNEDNKVRCVMRLDAEVWEKSKEFLKPLTRTAFIEATLRGVVDLNQKPFETIVESMIDHLGVSLMHTKVAKKKQRKLKKPCNK